MDIGFVMRDIEQEVSSAKGSPSPPTWAWRGVVQPCACEISYQSTRHAMCTSVVFLIRDVHFFDHQIDFPKSTVTVELRRRESTGCAAVHTRKPSSRQCCAVL